MSMSMSTVIILGVVLGYGTIAGLVFGFIKNRCSDLEHIADLIGMFWPLLLVVLPALGAGKFGSWVFTPRQKKVKLPEMKVL